jgi:Vanillate O-demethylase oxygenase C-terminal domain
MYLKNAWYLDVGICEVGKTRDDGVWVYTGHHLTPVSPTRTLYYWTVCRNHAIDDASVSAFWQGSIDYAFAVQDKPMIEAQQAALGARHVEEMKPVGIPADIGGAKARRARARLIADEAKGVRPELGASPLKDLLTKNAGSRDPVLHVV